jgi:hypothetical protein
LFCQLVKQIEGFFLPACHGGQCSKPTQVLAYMGGLSAAHSSNHRQRLPPPGTLWGGDLGQLLPDGQVVEPRLRSQDSHAASDPIVESKSLGNLVVNLSDLPRWAAPMARQYPWHPALESAHNTPLKLEMARFETMLPPSMADKSLQVCQAHTGAPINPYRLELPSLDELPHLSF